MWLCLARCSSTLHGQLQGPKKKTATEYDNGNNDVGEDCSESEIHHEMSHSKLPIFMCQIFYTTQYSFWINTNFLGFNSMYIHRYKYIYVWEMFWDLCGRWEAARSYFTTAHHQRNVENRQIPVKTRRALNEGGNAPSFFFIERNFTGLFVAPAKKLYVLAENKLSVVFMYFGKSDACIS